MLIKDKMHDLKLQLSYDEKRRAAEKVFLKIEETLDFQNANTILIYWSTHSELPTHQIIRTWSSTKTILLPTVYADKICLKKYLPLDELNAKDHRMNEPKTETYSGNVDLAIIPGVAFDKRKNRIGRGRGYYDAFLSANSISTFGVGYDFQILKKIPVRRGKMKMKKVFTPGSVVE